MFDRDQLARNGGDSAGLRSTIDSLNVLELCRIVDQYGWLGTAVVGSKANRCLWLVVQHADLGIQLRYLPLLEQSVKLHQSSAIDLAYLQDRVLQRQGKNQLYGTQVRLNAQGAYEFYPIEDEKHCSIRRMSLGLEPLEEYAKRFGINYQTPAK